MPHFMIIFLVLTRILKIGVKCCCPEKVGVLPYFSIETSQKVGVRNEKLVVTYSKSGVNEKGSIN